MSLKGFTRRLLYIWVVGILACMLVYTADLAPRPKYLLLGAIVACNIMGIGMLFGVYKFLLRAHDIVSNDILKIYEYFFGGTALRGLVLNKGSTLSRCFPRERSTYMLQNNSMGFPFVEELSSKVRIFHDKIKCHGKNSFKIIQSGSVKPGLSLITQPYVAQQQSWIDSRSSEEIIDLLHVLHQAKAYNLNIKLVRHALEILQQRACSEQAVCVVL